MVLYTLLPRFFHNTFMTLKASFRYVHFMYMFVLEKLVHFMYMFVLEKLVHFDIPWSRYRCLQGALLRTQIPLLSCIQFFKYFGQTMSLWGSLPRTGNPGSASVIPFTITPLPVLSDQRSWFLLWVYNRSANQCAYRLYPGLKGTSYILGWKTIN